MAPKARASSVPKAKAKAASAKPKAKAKDASPEPAAAPAPAEPAVAAAPAEPDLGAGPVPDPRDVTIEDAQKILRQLKPAEIVELANTRSAVEQLPARMALLYVGDKDQSWANAQTSLKTGKTFVNEMFEMEGDKYVTRLALETYDSLGTLDLEALAHPTARALGVYLNACLREARARFGPADAPPAAAPALAPGEPPQWPVKINFEQVIPSIYQAADWGKTALIVCGGKATIVDTFLAFRGFRLLDAKWVLSQNVIKKTMSVDEIREEVHDKYIVSAIKNGLPLGIVMSNSAVAFKETYCAEGTFPPSVFNWGRFKEEDEYSKIIREKDLETWVGAYPGKLKEGTVTFVTTDFTLEQAREYLPKALPYFDEMAIYEADGESIG